MKLITFTPAAEQIDRYLVHGTATVEYNGKQIDLPAYQMNHTVGTNSWVSTTVRGFAGRYETGTKVWHTSVIFNEQGKVTSIRGGLDNRARHNTCRVVGLWADTAEANQSAHAGA